MGLGLMAISTGKEGLGGCQKHGTDAKVDVFPIKSMRTNHHCDFFDDLNDRLIKDVR